MVDRPRDPRDSRGPRDAPDDLPAADRFEAYLDALLAGGRPSPEHIGSEDEAEMARMAAELAAAASGKAADPDPAFIEQLRLRMRQADEGIASIRTPLPLRHAQVAGERHPPSAPTVDGAEPIGRASCRERV